MELIVVAVILALLLLLSIGALFSIKTRSNLESDAQRIINTLRLARNKTISSEQANTYGVYFDNLSSPQKYILFGGTSFASRNPSYDTVFNLSSEINFQEINLGPPTEVVFSRIIGTANYAGNIKLKSTQNPSQVATIYIEASGKVDLAASSASSLPMKDSRHVHFNLGWSIQSATSLKFYFSAAVPPQTEIVAMAAYFNVDKTKFDWSGTFVVGGSEQKFRIHTHLLDPTQAPYTILSITRDRNNGKNNQEVYIYIDDKEIAHYLNNTVEAGIPWGGSMVIQ